MTLMSATSKGTELEWGTRCGLLADNLAEAARTIRQLWFPGQTRIACWFVFGVVVALGPGSLYPTGSGELLLDGIRTGFLTGNTQGNPHPL